MSDYAWDRMPPGTYRCEVLWDKANDRFIPDIRTARRINVEPAKKAKPLYVEYPRKKVTYETSDGQSFELQHVAARHQRQVDVAGWLNTNYFHGDAEGAMMMAEKMLKVWNMSLRDDDEGDFA